MEHVDRAATGVHGAERQAIVLNLLCGVFDANPQYGNVLSGLKHD